MTAQMPEPAWNEGLDEDYFASTDEWDTWLKNVMEKSTNNE